MTQSLSSRRTLPARFEIGDVVAATIDAQGLWKGLVYTIVDVESRPTAFGRFWNVVVEAPDTDETLEIANPHLLLRHVDTCPECGDAVEPGSLIGPDADGFYRCAPCAERLLPRPRFASGAARDVEHECVSETPANGHGAYCRVCGETVG